MRAYYKVGGVLVGREPDDVAKGLDLVGIDFAFDEMGAGLTIHLTHSDGTKTAVGPYDPAVAHLALAYAADGRPVTVTVVPAPPLADRKILLHPALGRYGGRVPRDTARPVRGPFRLEPGEGIGRARAD